MNETIYLIVKNPFKESDTSRFNTNFLEKHFNLIILDCSEWLLPESLKTRSAVNFNISNLSRIKSAHQFRNALAEKGGYALDFVGLFSFNAIRLFDILKKNGTQIIVVDSGPFPSPGPTKSTQTMIQKIIVIIKNKLFQRFIYARLLKFYEFITEDMTPDIALVSGRSWMSNARFSKAKVIIPAHSFDYETFLKVNSTSSETVKPYAVYLDENIGFHEDNKEMNLSSPVSGMSFLNQMESFFKYVEKQTGLEIKIAAYPSTDLNIYREVFKNRDIFFNQTAALIKDSELVFAHASTAISFAVLWRRPIFFILNSELKASWYYADVQSANELLNGKEVNIDFADQISDAVASWNTVDSKSYENYQDTFIKSKGSSSAFLWSILANHIYNRE